MSGQVSIEDAYAEACQALGESIVLQRLQGKELVRMAKERDDLLHMADHAPDPSA